MTLAVLTGPGFSIGCSDPVARRLTAQRQRRIEHWLGEAAARERAGVAKVDAGLREIGRIGEIDAQRTRQNRRELQEWISQDNRRWNRRQPAYRARIEMELAGKPEHARRTAIEMFF